MSESQYGTLHVRRIQQRTGRYLQDAIFPRYYKRLSAYIIRDSDGPEQMICGLRGKVLDTLTLEDDGRQVCVTGHFEWNPRVGPRKKLGEVTRARVEFVESVDAADQSTSPEPGSRG